MGQAINKTVTIGAASAVRAPKRPEAQQQNTPPPHHPVLGLWHAHCSCALRALQNPMMAPFPVVSCLCEARTHTPQCTRHLFICGICAC